MNVRAYGNDERLVFCREYLYKSKLSGVSEVLLLPIPSSRGVDTDKLLSDVEEIVRATERFANARRSDNILVAGYGIPKGIRDALAALGALILDVSLDEGFTLENARLTAIAALARLLNDERAAPCELSIGIVGYGRIGSALLGLLLALGARPVVFTANETARLELGISGVPTASYCTLKDGEGLHGVGHLDVVFNTAPAAIVGEGASSALKDTKILELASGENFPEGLKVVRLPSLPAKMYPKSAGICLAKSILRMLGEG